MKAKELREKSVEELNAELLNLLREQFNLRMQAASGQLQQSHLLKQVRRDVARVKTLLTVLHQRRRLRRRQEDRRAWRVLRRKD